MGKKIKITLVAALMSALVLSGSAAFGATCNGMTVREVSANDTASVAQVWLVNNNAAACGKVAAAGGQYLFNLPTANTDQMLATLLTAFSLDKKVWAAFDDSTNPGALQIVSMNQN